MVRDCASILPSTSSTGTCPQGVSRLRLLHASPVRMTSSNGTLCTANASRIGSARPGPSQSAHAGQRQRSQTSQTSCVGIRRESSGGQERQGRAAGARTGDFVGRHRSASAAADPALRHATPAAASLVSRGAAPGYCISSWPSSPATIIPTPAHRAHRAGSRRRHNRGGCRSRRARARCSACRWWCGGACWSWCGASSRAHRTISPCTL